MYLTLSLAEKIALLTSLHSMRNMLKKQALKVRAKRASKPRKKKDILSMLTLEQLKIFNKGKS